MTQTLPSARQPYPVRVRANLDAPLAVAGDMAAARAARTGSGRVVGRLHAGQPFALIAIVITGRYPPFRLDVGGDEPRDPTDPNR